MITSAARMIGNIARNSLKRGYLRVMLQKAGTRIDARHERRQARVSKLKCEALAENVAALANSADSTLWQASLEYSSAFGSFASNKMAELGVSLGGGGAYPLIYFIVRLRKPRVVVETGVAAGYSSHAVLAALATNGVGQLFSSDFPYFRLKDPEQYVGILVEASLRDRWHLFLEGDRKNLPKIITQVPEIDIFHYDSDKSYAGRAYAMSEVEPKLSAAAILMMDDIQDNMFFFDYAARRKLDFRVFEFNGKYVGVIGL